MFKKLLSITLLTGSAIAMSAAVSVTGPSNAALVKSVRDGAAKNAPTATTATNPHGRRRGS